MILLPGLYSCWNAAQCISWHLERCWYVPHTGLPARKSTVMSHTRQVTLDKARECAISVVFTTLDFLLWFQSVFLPLVGNRVDRKLECWILTAAASQSGVYRVSFLKSKIDIFVCVYVWICMCVYTMYLWVPAGANRGHWVPWPVVSDDCSYLGAERVGNTQPWSHL